MFRVVGSGKDTTFEFAGSIDDIHTHLVGLILSNDKGLIASYVALLSYS
jgi:hypothetical protein